MRWSRLIMISVASAAYGTLLAADAVGVTSGTPIDIAQILHAYGLAGIAGLLIYAQWRSHERMAAALDRHEAILLELVRENAKIAERSAKLADDLCRKLEARPCLRGADDGK